MRNIAIFGAMYSGKSTLAAALVDVGYVRVSFADPLRNVAALAYGTIDKSRQYDVVNQSGEQSVSGRQILQDLGEGVKQIDRDFWLKCFLRDSKRYLDQPLVLDDGRFIFELEALRNEGYLIVGVDTPQEVRLARARMIIGREPTVRELNHKSEVEIPFVINRVDLVVSGEGDVYSEAGAIIEKARNSYQGSR